jgi:hypothetical protein
MLDVGCLITYNPQPITSWKSMQEPLKEKHDAIIQSIQNRIYEIRNERVMLDFDVAALYEDLLLAYLVRLCFSQIHQEKLVMLTLMY